MGESDFNKLVLDNLGEIKKVQEDQAKVLVTNTEEVRQMKEQLKIQNGRVTRLEKNVPEVKKDFDLYRTKVDEEKEFERKEILENRQAMHQRMDAQDEILNCLSSGQKEIQTKIEDISAIFGGEDEYENFLRGVAAEQKFDEWKKRFWSKFFKICGGLALLIPAAYYAIQIIHSIH